MSTNIICRFLFTYLMLFSYKKNMLYLGHHNKMSYAGKNKQWKFISHSSAHNKAQEQELSDSLSDL